MVRYLIFEASTNNVIAGQNKVTEFKNFLKIELDCALDRQILDCIVNYVNSVLSRMSVQTRGRNYIFSRDELVLILATGKHYLGSGLGLKPTFKSCVGETKKYKYLSDSILNNHKSDTSILTFDDDHKIEDAPLILGGYFIRGVVVDEFTISCAAIVQQQHKPGDLLLYMKKPRGSGNREDEFVEFYGTI